MILIKQMMQVISGTENIHDGANRLQKGNDAASPHPSPYSPNHLYQSLFRKDIVPEMNMNLFPVPEKTGRVFVLTKRRP